MKVGNTPLTWNRLEENTRNSRGFDITMRAASDADRRMEHSSMEVSDPTMNFWNLLGSIPRRDQAAVAANGLASRLAQNGVNDANLSLIRSFPAKFTREEMINIEGLLKENPLLKMSGGDSNKEILEQLKEIWMGSENRQGFTPDRVPVQNPGGQNPVEMFFRSSFWRKPGNDDYKKAAAVSL